MFTIMSNQGLALTLMSANAQRVVITGMVSPGHIGESVPGIVVTSIDSTYSQAVFTLRRIGFAYRKSARAQDQVCTYSGKLSPHIGALATAGETRQ